MSSFHWCVTCFDVAKPLEFDEAVVKYAIYQPELTSEKRKHFQCYIELYKKQRRPTKQFPKGCHFEARQGSDVAAREYCTPDYKYSAMHSGKPTPPHKIGKTKAELEELYGPPVEFGVFKPVTAGQRTDIDEWHESIKSGKTLDEVMLLFPQETLKHSGGMAAYFNAFHRVNPPPPEITELREWQLDLEKILLGPVDDRKIIWVSDPSGNSGKTAFIKYMVCKHKAFATSNGKSADIAHAWKGEKIVLFNFPKSSIAHINYGVVECIKDGLISSPKYDSHTKCYPRPHIVCMANCLPDMTAWIPDRYQIILL